MKKLITLALALILMFSLIACGDEKSSENSRQPDDTSKTASGQGDITDTSIDIGDIDFGSIIAGNGETDIVWGKQDEATKQAIIDAARESGMDISFGADGSTTIKDSDGMELVQKSDGTWIFKDEDGQAQIGGSWPDNEYTALIPKPDFQLISATCDDEFFAATFMGATVEQMREYVEEVKERGFTIDPQVQDQEVMGVLVFAYYASNAEGYGIEIVSSGGTSGITVRK